MGNTLKNLLEKSKGSGSFLIAEVVDNLDTPEAYDTGKLIGRVKIRIPGVSDDEQAIPTEILPWAYCMSQTGSGTHEGMGAFRIPAIGTKVICAKLNNKNGYIVLGELNTTLHNREDYFEDYPETWGMRDKTGNKSVINMFKNYAQFTHMSGTNILIEEDGDTTCTVVKDLESYITGYGKWVYGEYLDETIGEYRKETIGTYHSETVGTYWTKHVADWGTERYGTTFYLNAGSMITLKAPVIVLDGNVVVNGWVMASGDVIAGHISLQGHKHFIVSGSSAGITSPSIP